MNINSIQVVKNIIRFYKDVESSNSNNVIREIWESVYANFNDEVNLCKNENFFLKCQENSPVCLFQPQNFDSIKFWNFIIDTSFIIDEIKLDIRGNIIWTG